FRNPKLVHSISIHFIRVICGGSIRDEKQHIPADFSILPVNGYHIREIVWDRGHLARHCPQGAIGPAVPMDALEMGLDLNATIFGHHRPVHQVNHRGQ
ncbi:MAG: hypothetical protein M1472_03530, partial [Planctomycetes bacterium]|nr:hypothetical protein [Planctomycetota bacterium]